MRVYVRSVIAVACLVAYLLIFGAGLLLSSRAHREWITSGAVAAAVEGAGFTPVNVAFLTVLAGLIGGCARNVRRRGRDALEDAGSARAQRRSARPAASLLRSFAVYLAFVAAVLVASDDSFANPSREQYVRIAATLSFFAFVVGYDPTRLTGILSLAGPRRGVGR